ncbi:CorA metal ion transporter [Rhodotorula kratochvilovae]
MSSPTAGPSRRRSSHGSTHSSPRPQSEIGLEDSRQAEQDIHLAHSMASSTNQGRARSNTQRDRPPLAALTSAGGGSDLATPQRGASSSGNVHSHSDGPPVPRNRRTSVTLHLGSGDAMNAMGHLADDLAREDREEEQRAEQEEHERSAAYIRRDDLSRVHRTPSSVQRSAAAARLYRHHRNVSDSSIDSQGGAYIDHRRQPHSLSIGTTPRAQVLARSPEAYGGSAPRRSALRRFSTSDDEPGARSPTSPRAVDLGPSSGYSSRTARTPYAAADLEENAVAEDELPRSPRPVHFLDRHPSQTSFHSRHSSRSRHDDDDESRHGAPYGADMSRPGSGFGKPEDDICFPAHGAAAELDYMDMHEGHPDDVMPMAGVLPNFPYPFDFGALEEFATSERKGMPIPSARRRKGGAGAGAAAAASSPPEYGVSSATMTAGRYTGGPMSSSSEADVPRMGGRHRKLSESVHPGRMRRKLAQFEGAGDDLAAAAGGDPQRPQRGDEHFVSILDTKTPLLADKRAAGGGYGTAGAGDGGRGKAGGPRPYRFSFYSNALPSTIHARSLAEIPGDQQTFEELFLGHRPAPIIDEDERPTVINLDARLAELSSPQQSSVSGGVGTASGAATPNGASLAGSTRKNGAGGALPSGISNTRMQGGDRPRNTVMRSDEDAEANTWWLDVMCPTDQEMKILSKVFGIHPLTTEDIQMEETREKIELFRNYYFVCFRSFEQDPYSPTYLEPLNMYIIVFREGTLSFHFRGTPHPQNVRRRIKQLKDYINVTSDWISYALIDDITDAFGPLIQNIEYEVDSIDELVLILKEAEQSDMLRRIGTCRKKVMGLLRLMGNKADVVKGLSKRCNENWSVAPKSDIGLYLSDIQDHITTSTQNLTHYEKILSRSHSNYLAQISIEMTDANNQINDVLSKLTALGTVLIPMNLVTGLWGMNVHVPGEGVDGLGWFFGIVGCLVAFAIFGAFLTWRVFVRPN